MTSWPDASTLSIGRYAVAGQRAVAAGVDVELDRGAVERGAVLELDAVADVQRPLRVVGVVVDALDEVRHRLAVLVDGEQRVADPPQHGEAARRARARYGAHGLALSASRP